MARCMDEINLRDCINYLDETKTSSFGFDEHLERLEAVFKCLQECILKRKGSKCDFFKGRISYIGHIVSLLVEYIY